MYNDQQIIFDAEVQDLCRTPPTARGQNTHTLDLLLRPSQRYNRTTITDGEARDTVHHLSDFSSNKFPDISGAPRPTVVTCNYVVVADGAGSTVRTAAGIGLSGQKGLGYLVNIHFRCVGLGRLLRDTGRRAGMLYFVYNEACQRAVEGGRGGIRNLHAVAGGTLTIGPRLDRARGCGEKS